MVNTLKLFNQYLKLEKKNHTALFCKRSIPDPDFIYGRYIFSLNGYSIHVAPIVDGVLLNSIPNNIDRRELYRGFRRLYLKLKSLNNIGFHHRDVNLGNIIYEAGVLRLIDWEHVSRLSEKKIFIKSKKGLGYPCYFAPYLWNDRYSLCKLILPYMHDPEFIERVIKIKNLHEKDMHVKHSIFKLNILENIEKAEILLDKEKKFVNTGELNHILAGSLGEVIEFSAVFMHTTSKTCSQFEKLFIEVGRNNKTEILKYVLLGKVDSFECIFPRNLLDFILPFEGNYLLLLIKLIFVSMKFDAISLKIIVDRSKGSRDSHLVRRNILGRKYLISSIRLALWLILKK